jgi:hypothetical protein
MTETTFTWDISNLERETADGFVYVAHYTVNATDETFSAGAYGSIGFQRPDELIPFEDLTKSLVLEWVHDALGEERVSEMEASLQSQIDEQHSPSRASGTPWSA